MPTLFTIPNEADAFHAHQAQHDSVDFDILVQGYNDEGVISGSEVTAQGTPDMTVAVAAGTVRIGGSNVAHSGDAALAITAADADNPRFTLIAVDNGGTVSAVDGTASDTPVFPAVPNNSVILVACYVPAGATSIITSYIVGKSVLVSVGVSDHGSLTGLSDDDHTQYHNNTRGDARYYTQTQLDGGQLDGQYFQESEFLNSSAGAGDAGKPIVLDAAGHIDATMLNDADVDHGSIGGLADDDHTQYLLANGSRALAGAWDMGNYALTNVNIDSGVITGITDLAVADGGTGASTAADARTNLGLVAGGAGDIWVEKAGDSMTGALTMSGASSATRTITTAAADVALQQTGDTFGSSTLTMQSRLGSAGAVFQSGSLDLVDFGFKGSSGKQDNLRMEFRAAGGVIGAGNSTYGEFQVIMNPLNNPNDSWPFIVGDQTAVFGAGQNATAETKVGIGETSPGARLHINTETSTVKGAIIRGAASQSANLLELQESDTSIFLASGDGLAGSEFVINEQGEAIDVRIETDNYDALFIDGSEDSIDIMHHASGKIGFFAQTPATRVAAYTPSNVTPDRSYDADTVAVAELADVVGTIIADLQTYGLFQ